jgi:hypothetical protein
MTTRKPNEDDLAKAQIAHSAFSMASVAVTSRDRYAYLQVGCNTLTELFGTADIADEQLEAIHVTNLGGATAIRMEMRECALDCLSECLQKAVTLARLEETVFLTHDEQVDNGAICTQLMRLAAQWTKRAGYEALTPGLLAASGVSELDLNMLLTLQAEQAVPAPRPPSAPFAFIS